MSEIVVGVVAIAGTLLGAALTYVLQARSARQAHEFALRQQLWQERLGVYSAFAGVMTDFRAWVIADPVGAATGSPSRRAVSRPQTWT
jgi:hypothetical protein